MKLIDGIDFGPVWAMSGAMNFFGDGWPQHRYFENLFPEGFNLEGMTFVAKTTTAEPRSGNMRLRRNLMPVHFLPDCIHVSPRSFLHGSMLNAVGLSGPGIRKLLDTGRWAQREKPFMISFMPVELTKEGRLCEVITFVRELNLYISHGRGFLAPIAIQLNLSCPNTGHDLKSFMGEVPEWLNRMSILKLPIILKFSVTTEPRVVFELCKHSSCYGICISNTVPWGELLYYPKTGLGIPWKKVFGTTESPLARYGGGGYSGKYLLPLVKNWLQRFDRHLDTDPALEKKLHINAGGGILHPVDVESLFKWGVDSVSIGAAMILRPWRIASLIETAHRLAAMRYQEGDEDDEFLQEKH